MKAMVLRQYGPIETSPLRLEELPDPEPAPGEARIRVRWSAICRTDLHVIEGELAPRRLPVIPGHQVVGVVDRLGKGCTRLRIGQRVGIAWLGETCGRCVYCRSGRENLCLEPRFTGYDRDGGYAELATVREDFAYLLPEKGDDLSVAPLLCAGIIGYRALARARAPRGGTLGIFGFGSSAHIVIQLAIRRGCRVYVVSRAPAHLELARGLGAAWASTTAQGLPELLDSAIIFAPAGELIPVALASVGRGGTVAVAGIHVSAIPTLEYEEHLFYERDLRSVTANTRQDGIELLQEAEEARIRPRTTEYALSEANRALQDLKQDRISGTGVLRVF